MLEESEEKDAQKRAIFTDEVKAMQVVEHIRL